MTTPRPPRGWLEDPAMLNRALWVLLSGPGARPVSELVAERRALAGVPGLMNEAEEIYQRAYTLGQDAPTIEEMTQGHAVERILRVYPWLDAINAATLAGRAIYDFFR